MDLAVSDILVALIGGTIVGVLAKWIAPSGRDNIPLWLTIICGIGGVFIGTYLYSLLWDPSTGGVIDFWRHVWQIATAAVLVVIAAGLTSRGSTSH